MFKELSRLAGLNGFYFIAIVYSILLCKHLRKKFRCMVDMQIKDLSYKDIRHKVQCWFCVDLFLQLPKGSNDFLNNL